MDNSSSANENNSDFNTPNLGSDVLGSQFEVPHSNIPIPSSNQLSSQMDNIKYDPLNEKLI